jgi:hypothetical protein
MAWASRKEGDRVGVGPVTEQVVESNDPHGGQRVPKRWHIKFGRREITQRKAYNIQNTPKVWNQ